MIKTLSAKAATHEEEAFPSGAELAVSSALLLLSTITPTNSEKKLKVPKICKRSCSEPKTVTSTTSSVTSDRDRKRSSGSTAVLASRARQLKAVATFVASFHEVRKIKVVRKKRTKTCCISAGQKPISSSKDAEDSSAFGSASGSAVSCLTSNSCGESSVKSRVGLGETDSLLKRKPDKVVKGNTGNRIGSAHMKRRAEAILKVLSSHGCASEVRIRELLGDSPDTSKALRILLKREQVKRHGAGGRTDPYIYMIA